jgi:hypothetical protein
VTGEKISLGNFTKNFNWLELNASSELPMSASGVFYHEQYYEAGSVCEENHQPRRTLVKVFIKERANRKSPNKKTLKILKKSNQNFRNLGNPSQPKSFYRTFDN